MKITVFQSDKGDCLLLQDDDGRTLLADGGMKSSYIEHVRPAMGRLRKQGVGLDLVYVSHIDQDHIAGILQMMDDEIAWRRYDYHRKQKSGSRVKRPNFPRPPEVKQVWHNSFFDMVPLNRGKIEEALAASSFILDSMSQQGWNREENTSSQLITSERQALRLSARLSAKQLNIPLNTSFDGKLGLLPARPKKICLGKMRIAVIGPSSSDMQNLRDEWNNWLKDNRKTISQLRRLGKADSLGTSSGSIHEPYNFSMENFYNFRDIRNRVSIPNLASLMLHVESNGKSILLTGDGHSVDVLKGLKRQKLLRDDGSIHVSVLKIMHHGSDHNFNKEFFQRVTADHYVFCGNGAHDNPEIKTLTWLIDSRIGRIQHPSGNKETNKPFKIWINSHASVTHKYYVKHMENLENYITSRQRNNYNKLRCVFLKNSSFNIEL